MKISKETKQETEPDFSYLNSITREFDKTVFNVNDYVSRHFTHIYTVKIVSIYQYLNDVYICFDKFYNPISITQNDFNNLIKK